MAILRRSNSLLRRITGEDVFDFAKRTSTRLSKIVYEKKEHLLLRLQITTLFRAQQIEAGPVNIEAIRDEQRIDEIGGLSHRQREELKRVVRRQQPCFVAICDNSALGFTYYRIDAFFQSRMLARPMRLNENEALVNWIYVNPHFVGKSIGKHMAKCSILHMGKAGYRSFSTIVSSSNMPSRKLFTSLGFELSERVERVRVLCWSKTRRSVSTPKDTLMAEDSSRDLPGTGGT